MDVKKFLNDCAADIPDPDHVWQDCHGQVWFRFLIEYDTADGKMATDLWARDIDHAERLLTDLRNTGEIVGQAYRTIDG